MRGPKLTVYPKGVLLETYRRRLIALRDDGFNDDFMAALEEVHRQLEKHDALAARLATCERERDAAIRGHDAAHAACVDYEARLAEAEHLILRMAGEDYQRARFYVEKYDLTGERAAVSANEVQK